MVKIIDAQLQDWENQLKLPEVKNSDLLKEAQNIFIDDDAVLSDTTQKEDYPIHRLMMTYEQKWLDTPALACLNLMALFSYPVSKEVLLTVLEGTTQQQERWSQRRDGLNKILNPLLENGRPNVFKLETTLQELDEAGLLASHNTHNATTIALYRPIATYFSTPLKNRYFDDWCCYQQHLVQCYEDLALRETDTLKRLWLNSKKLLHSLATTHKQQAMDNIYRPEISPLLSNLCCSNSAACRLKLHLLSGFFQQLWDKTDFCISPEAKAYLQAEAGQALYRLDDQESALKLMERAYPVLLEENSWQAAGDVAYLLGQHTFTVDQSKSIEFTRKSVSLAEKEQDTKTVLHRLRSLFDLYKGNGNIQEAGLIADKAKELSQSLRNAN